jgi:hypothetical protein
MSGLDEGYFRYQARRFETTREADLLTSKSVAEIEILQEKWGKLDGLYKVIESGHWPMITKPAELVEDMLSL